MPVILLLAVNLKKEIQLSKVNPIVTVTEEGYYHCSYCGDVKDNSSEHHNQACPYHDDRLENMERLLIETQKIMTEKK